MGVKVSYFSKVSNEIPKSYDLLKWCEDTINPSEDLKNKVLKYRESGNQSIKRSLPCITVSASFKGKRNLEKIKKKTGFICLDIDAKENPFINLKKLKKWFSKLDFVFYVGDSVGGGGIYVIVKIDSKVKLKKYFKFLDKRLREKGVIIDQSCKDYTRLRIFSYDKKAYLNPKARTLKLPKKKKVKKLNYANDFSKTNLNKVEAVVSLIERTKTDITSDYNDWVKIAGALHNSFGETGRQFFHRISKFHSGYKFKKADKKFDHCINMRKVSLSSFFYIANSYGIRY